MGEFNWGPIDLPFDMEDWHQISFTWDTKIGRFSIDGRIICERAGAPDLGDTATLGGGGFKGSLTRSSSTHGAWNRKRWKTSMLGESYRLPSQ